MMDEKSLLFSKNFCGLFHIFQNRDMEWESCFTGAAFDAFARVVCKHFVMFPDSFWDGIFCTCQIQKLGDRRNVNFFRTRSTMAAIHTVAFPTDIRKRSKGRRIIFFFFRCGFIGDALLKLLQRVCACQDRSNSRACQRIVQALMYTQCFFCRGKLFVSQVAAAERFHYGNADTKCLACLI